MKPSFLARFCLLFLFVGEVFSSNPYGDEEQRGPCARPPSRPALQTVDLNRGNSSGGGAPYSALYWESVTTVTRRTISWEPIICNGIFGWKKVTTEVHSRRSPSPPPSPPSPPYSPVNVEAYPTLYMLPVQKGGLSPGALSNEHFQQFLQK